MKKYLFIIGFLIFSINAMAQGTQKINGLRFTPKAAPGTPVDGEVYYDSTTKKTYQWNGTSWIDWSSVITLDATLQDGSTNGVENNAVFDALALKANDIDVVRLTGNQSISGTKTFNGETRLNGVVKLDNELWLNDNGDTNYFAVQEDVNNGLWFKNFTSNQSSAPELEKSYTLNFSGDPVNPQDVADKEYVDAQVAGAGVTLESTLIDGSTNGVENNAVFDALALKGSLGAANIWTSTNTFNNPVLQSGVTFGNNENANYVRSLFTSNSLWYLDVSGAGNAFGYNFGTEKWIFPSNHTFSDPTLSNQAATKGYVDAQVATSTPADNSVTSAKIVDGTIALADLSATGTPTASTYLRGDNTWATVAGGGTAATTTYDNTASGLTATNVKTAIDEVNSKVTTDLSWEAASTKTLAIADAGKIFKNTGATDFTVTVPTNANVTYGKDVAFTFYTESTGKIFVDGEAGSNVSPREISGTEKSASLLRDGVDNWHWMGTTLPYNPITELYTTANAVSLNDEANAYTGISEVGTGSLATNNTTPIAGDAQSGSYHGRLVGGGGTSERAEIAWSGRSIGENIRFSIWVKVSAGGGYFNAWTGVQTIGGGTADPEAGGGPAVFTNTVWTQYTFDLELTATSGIVRIYADNGSTANIDFDSFSMTAL